MVAELKTLLNPLLCGIYHYQRVVVFYYMEVWKDIKGYENLYTISSLGRVKSLQRLDVIGRRINEKILVNSSDCYGYKQVCLYKNKNQKTRRIHQLVAIAFLNHTPNGSCDLIVDHKNNVSIDNRVENLQLITTRKNTSKDKKGYSSENIGVSWNKKSCKWKSTISVNGKNKHLGSFKTELEAVGFYQCALGKIEDGTPEDIDIKKPLYSSKYKGVSWHKSSGKWMVRMKINGKRKHLGLFTKELDAHNHYQKILKDWV